MDIDLIIKCLLFLVACSMFFGGSSSSDAYQDDIDDWWTSDLNEVGPNYYKD